MQKAYERLLEEYKRRFERERGREFTAEDFEKMLVAGGAENIIYPRRPTPPGGKRDE